MSEPDRPVILGFSADEVDCIVSALRLAASCSALMNKTGEQQINLHLADAVLRASLNAGAPTVPMCSACDPPHPIEPKPDDLLRLLLAGASESVRTCPGCRRAWGIAIEQGDNLVAMMADRDLQHKRLVEVEGKLAEATDRARMLKTDLDAARVSINRLSQYGLLCSSLRTQLRDEENRNRELCAEIIALKAERDILNEALVTKREGSKLTKALEALRRVQDRAQSIRDIAKDGME